MTIPTPAQAEQLGQLAQATDRVAQLEADRREVLTALRTIDRRPDPEDRARLHELRDQILTWRSRVRALRALLTLQGVDFRDREVTP